MAHSISLTKVLGVIAVATVLPFAIHYLEFGPGPEPIPEDERSAAEESFSKLLETSQYEGGQLTRKRNGFVEDCRLHIVLDKPRGQCRDDDAYFKRLVTVDLRALDLSQVNVRSHQNGVEPSSSVLLRIGFNDAFERQHREYSKKSGVIASQENRRFPSNVQRRLQSQKRRLEAELSSDAFEIASETYSYCSGLEVRAPLARPSVILSVTEPEPSRFLELVERYRVSFCID